MNFEKKAYDRGREDFLRLQMVGLGVSIKQRGVN